VASVVRCYLSVSLFSEGYGISAAGHMSLPDMVRVTKMDLLNLYSGECVLTYI